MLVLTFSSSPPMMCVMISGESICSAHIHFFTATDPLKISARPVFTPPQLLRFLVLREIKSDLVRPVCPEKVHW